LNRTVACRNDAAKAPKTGARRGAGERGRYNAVPPGPFAGNLDNRDLVESTTLLVPAFVRGALAWTGDSHAAQGNGEINLTALETAFQEIVLTITVDKTTMSGREGRALPRFQGPVGQVLKRE
jgi:acetamidase/formamidase